MKILQDAQAKFKLWIDGFKSPDNLWLYGITAVVVIAVIRFMRINVWAKSKRRAPRRRRRQRPIIVRNYRKR